MKSVGFKKNKASNFLTFKVLFCALSIAMVFSHTAQANNGSDTGGAKFILMEFADAVSVDDVIKVNKFCQEKYVQKAFEQMCKSVNAKIYDRPIERYSSIVPPFCISEDSDGDIKDLIQREEYGSNIKYGEIYFKYRYVKLEAKGTHLVVDEKDIITTGSYNSFAVFIPEKYTIKKLILKREKNNYFINTSNQRKTDYMIESELAAKCFETELQKLSKKEIKYSTPSKIN